MKQRLINIIASPFSIALVLFAIVLLFVPENLFTKYKTEFISQSVKTPADYIFYNDLDNDGKSEKIKRYIDKDGMNAMNVYMPDGTIIDQFNFRREAIISVILNAVDRDNNGLKEVYSLSHSRDSIFLNWTEPLNDSDNVPKSKFITTMSLNKYGKIDYMISFLKCSDLDNDGYNEVLFGINGGYSKFPRAVFAYDFKKDSVYRSPFTGAKCFISDIEDINGDGYPEIALKTYANANIYPNDSCLDDTHSYLMVLDHNLNFLFEPVSFWGYPSSVRIFFQKNKNKWTIIGQFSLSGKNGENSKLFIYDPTGKEIKRVENINNQNIFIRSKSDSNTYVLCENRLNKVLFFDNNLNLKKTNESLINIVSQLDLDNDGLYEWVNLNNSDYQTVNIFRHDMSGCVSIKLPSSCGTNRPFKADRIENGDKTFLHIQRAGKNYIYRYYHNKYYYLKYPFYSGIYLFLLMIVVGIQKLQKFQTERKIAIEKQISELQLKTIRSQMDPHFTFNALNTIGSIIYKEDKEQAHRYFTKFSKLVRATLEASDKITRTLKEELDFVENYLTLEKIRFHDKFNYSINVSDSVNKNRMIPKMIIQIYVENAIKHGLKHKEKNGKLTINVTTTDKDLLITVEDNGIGRKRAKEMKTFGTGKGLNIMNNIFLLYYKLHKVKISQTINDLLDKDGNPAGTKVEIIIPSESKISG